MGKVHGSLARAGKVRGQCPKVAKQEKKKNPKGRALKRLKYNRRFVNTSRKLARASRWSRSSESDLKVCSWDSTLC
ncbi:ribosomal protein S30A [Cymbomonas tetramitiformis]|uniref:40S ribosomal protein S30 n=1 Tax=Cymbomonas tetramitiformis TaxID=36881 RepID=A0AAE0FRH6_9CHLO|nr:ribosomal protein S30A [Cymbomonas tetramitiformis]